MFGMVNNRTILLPTLNPGCLKEPDEVPIEIFVFVAMEKLPGHKRMFNSPIPES